MISGCQGTVHVDLLERPFLQTAEDVPLNSSVCGQVGTELLKQMKHAHSVSLSASTLEND